MRERPNMKFQQQQQQQQQKKNSTDAPYNHRLLGNKTKVTAASFFTISLTLSGFKLRLIFT